MALIKTLASYRKPDGTWHPQEEVVMGPLEEAAMLAEWARGEHEAIKPQQMSTDEKLNMLLQDSILGRANVLSANASFESLIAEWENRRNELHADCDAKWRAYNEELAKRPPGTKTC